MKEQTKPKQTTRHTLLAKLALLLVAFLWGSSLTVVKDVSAVFNPLLILALRFSIAGLILVVIFWRKVKNATKADWINGIKIGICLFAAYTSQTLGVTYTDPGRSAFLSASYCVIVPFLAWWLINKKPDKFNLIAALLVIVGIYFVSMAGNSVFKAGKDAVIGDGLALVSGFLFALHIVAITKYSDGRDPILMTIVQFIVAALLSWPATFLFENNQGLELTRPAVLEMLYLAVLCTALAILLQNLGQRYTNESTAAIILTLESVFGIIIPVFLGIEQLTKYTLIGFSLIFLAIIISETKLSFLLDKETSSTTQP